MQKIICGFQPFIIFASSSFFDVWLGSEYASRIGSQQLKILVSWNLSTATLHVLRHLKFITVTKPINIHLSSSPNHVIVVEFMACACPDIIADASKFLPLYWKLYSHIFFLNLVLYAVQESLFLCTLLF